MAVSRSDAWWVGVFGRSGRVFSISGISVAFLKVGLIRVILSFTVAGFASQLLAKSKQYLQNLDKVQLQSAGVSI